MEFAAVLALARGPSPAAWWSATALLTVVLTAVAVIDWRTLRIPDALTLPLIAVGILVTAACPGIAPVGRAIGDHATGAVIGYAAFAGIGAWLWHRRGTEALGLGDAKLFAAAGAWMGWQSLPQVLLVASVTGLGFAAVSRVTFRPVSRQIAFGPWLAFGFLLTWLVPVQ